MPQPSNQRLLTESRRGVPGGIAALDAAGDVIDATGTKIKGGGTPAAPFKQYATLAAAQAGLAANEFADGDYIVIG